MAYRRKWDLGQGTESGDKDKDLQHRFKEVEEEIVQLRVQSNELIEGRGILKQQMNAQLSPLLRLPTEILREISMTAFPSGIRAGLRETATPLLLGSICRTWRDIAWSMPQLWSSVYVEIQNQYHASKASLLQEWLLRCQNRPISVFMKLPKMTDGVPRGDADVMWKILDIVARASEQWQHVHLDIPEFFDKHKCFVPKSFPKLLSLSVPSELEIEVQDFNMFQYAPVLSEVSFNATSYTKISFPIHTLLRLTIGHAWSSDVLNFLDRHPNLTHCTFPRIFESGSDCQRVEALSLILLSIGFVRTQHAITPLLDNLFTPRLCNLNIQMQPFSPIPHSTLVSFLLRSSHTLVRLCLGRCDITEVELVECLETIPSLRELKLVGMLIGTHTLHKLSIWEDTESPLLLPQLRSLFIVFKEPEDQVLFNFVALEEMVRSRRPEAIKASSSRKWVAEMKSLTVHLPSVRKESEGLPTLSVLACFQELEREGMSIQFATLDEEDNFE